MGNFEGNGASFGVGWVLVRESLRGRETSCQGWEHPLKAHRKLPDLLLPFCSRMYLSSHICGHASLELFFGSGVPSSSSLRVPVAEPCHPRRSHLNRGKTTPILHKRTPREGKTPSNVSKMPQYKTTLKSGCDSSFCDLNKSTSHIHRERISRRRVLRGRTEI